MRKVLELVRSRRDKSAARFVQLVHSYCSAGVGSRSHASSSGRLWPQMKVSLRARTRLIRQRAAAIGSAAVTTKGNTMRPQPPSVSEPSPKKNESTVARLNDAARVGVTPTSGVMSRTGEKNSKDFFADLQARSRLHCAGCGHPFAQHTVSRVGQVVCMAWHGQLEKFCDCDDFGW